MPGGGKIPPERQAVLDSNARLLDRQAALLRELAEVSAALAENARDENA